MSRGTNQKFKFTYLMQVMLEKTDDEHSLTLSQILEELDKYGVTAERKSIYTDLQDMEKFGIEVIKEQIGSCGRKRLRTGRGKAPDRCDPVCEVHYRTEVP